MPIRFTCVCGKKLKADDSQAGRRARCSGCGQELVVPSANHADAAPSPAPPPLPAPAATNRWHYARGGQVAGAGSLDELRWLVAFGQLLPSDQVLSPGAAQWTPASQVAELFAPAASDRAANASSEKATSAAGPIFDSRHEALSEAQVVPDADRCVQCGICSFNCPMGIDVRAHAWRGRPIHDSHCLTCSQCVQRCPRGVLRFERISLFTLDT